MRIRDFSIDRFGVLAGQAVSDLPPGVTVILGDNEAGKSTCLQFFRAMLFGYARNRRSIDYATDGKAPSGGTLLLETGDLGLLRLTRRPGPHGGPATLTRPDGSACPASDLALLLRGCTADLYDKVFAFSLTDLAQFGALKEEGIRNALHGAAFGTGLRSPGQVLKELDEGMKRLFAPRAATSKVHRLLDELEALQAVLAEKGNEVARYAALRTELAAVDADLEAAKGARKALEAEQRGLEQKRALRRRWEAVRDAEAALAALPEIPGVFAADSRERLDGLLQRLEDRRLAGAGAESALLRLEQDLAGQAGRADPVLLAAHGPLGSLRERKESIRRASALLSDLAGEQAAHARIVAESCANLGSGWDAARVEAFELTLALREECAGLGRELERAEREAAAAEDACRRLDRECVAAGAALRSAGNPAEKPDADFPDEAVAERLHALLLRAAEAHENTGALALARRGAEKALDQALSAVHPDWTRQKQEQLSLGIAEREALAVVAAAAAAAGEARAESSRAAEQAEAALAEARQRLEALLGADAGDGAGKGGRTPAERGEGLRRTQAAWRLLEAARRRHETRNEQLNDVVTARSAASIPARAAPRGPARLSAPRPLTLAAGLLALAAGGTALYAGDLSASSPLVHAGAGELILALALLALGLKSRAGANAVSAEKALQELEDRLIRARQAARRTVAETETILNGALAESPDLFPEGTYNRDFLPELLPGLLADAERRVMREKEALALRERDNSYLEREKAALLFAEQRAAEAARRREAALESESRAAGVWRDALARHALPPDTDPRNLGLLLEKIDAAASRRSAWEGRAAACRDAEERLAACLELARTVPALADILASLPETGSGLDPEPGPWLDAVRRSLAGWREAGHERIRVRGLIDERENRLRETRAAFARAEQDREAARAALAEKRRAWSAWLSGCRLSPGLSPETARLALETAARAKTALEQAQLQGERGAARARELAAFARELAARAAVLAPEHAALPAVRQLADADPAQFAALSRGAPAAASAALSLLDELAARAEAAANAQLLRASREGELPALRDALARARAQISATEEEIAELLRLGRCGSAEEYRRAHGLWQQRETALAARNALAAALERDAAEAGLPSAPPHADLAEADERELAERAAAAEALLGEAAGRERALAERRGGLAGAMSGLLNDAGLQELLGREESLKEDIARQAEEWSRLALARQLLLSAKRRFESERQTGVARHAGELFRSFTGGAYSAISVSLDDESVQAVSRRGEVKNAESGLSRGTREQLYLALRLAYVRDHGAQAETLPVIMDDILVNFDARRAGNTAAALAAFARDNQILFFTCHEATAGMLADAAPGSARCLLRDGVFERVL